MLSVEGGVVRVDGRGLMVEARERRVEGGGLTSPPRSASLAGAERALPLVPGVGFRVQGLGFRM